MDRPLVSLPSFGCLQTNGTAQNMGRARASPWAADLTEAAALLFSSSRVPMVNSSPHHPLRLSLSILPSPVVLLILGTCFVLHTARRFYIVLSSRTEHCWRAGQKAGRSVIDSILLDRTDCLVPSSRSNMRGPREGLQESRILVGYPFPVLGIQMTSNWCDIPQSLSLAKTHGG